MKEAREYCTCTDYKCPCHPVNHEQGCSLCVQKNLKQKEIPSCFFHDIACEKPTPDWHYQDFARLVEKAERNGVLNTACRAGGQDESGNKSEVDLTKEEKVQRYKILNESCLKGQIVFAGSSLMEMFPIEKFAEEDHLGMTVYNRGIGGYVTQELLDSIDACILDLKPSRLFINIGTNDLSNADISIGEIMAQYEKLLDQVLAEIPGCRITLMAYYPVNYEAAIEEMKPVLEIRSNDKITLANQAVRELARRKGLRFIDVNDPLKDGLGRLKAEYTIEGMHITEEGYRAIYPLVKEYLINPD